MAIASVLILGLVPLAIGDATVRPPATEAVNASGLHAASSLSNRAVHPRPRGTRRVIFFWEEEEDDTSDDDAPTESALWFVASHLGTRSGDPLALRGTGRIFSRSASPTLRLRC